MKKSPEKSHSPDQRDKGGPSHADAEYFARAMADVVRLAPDPRGRVRTAPQGATPRAPTPSTSSPAGQDHDDSSEGDFVAPGVDRRELRKLKRGEHAPGKKFDLHGMTAAEAVASSKRFIDNARPRHRSVCIVHGRGLHSERNVAIVKARVRECLRQHRGVLAYCDAPQADGGTGAVYVLLRR